MKESTKMMRYAMKVMKRRFTECTLKNAPCCLPYCESDKDIIGKIKAIEETISFFEMQKEAMEELVSTSAHKSYIRKITCWIIELKCIKSDFIDVLNDIRAAKGGDDQDG